MAAWQRQAPEGFIYALKAPQKLTHERPHDQSEMLRYLSQFSETAGQSPRANSLPVPALADVLIWPGCDPGWISFPRVSITYLSFAIRPGTWRKCASC